MKSIILAIILAESGFNPKAYNKQGDASGLGQITPIAVLEAHRVCGLSKKPDLFNADINIKYTKCIYQHYRKISRSDVEAVIMYHSGFTGRARFRKGLSPGKKTMKYALKVLHYENLFRDGLITTERFCKKYKLPSELCQQ